MFASILNFSRPLVFAICFGALFVGCNDSAQIDPGPLFSAYQAENAPGVAVMVIKDGEVVYQGLFGVADLETGMPIDSATNFRLASVTKQFTAMSVLMLVEKGAFTPETSLRQVFPEFAPFADSITVRHLLNHTSGLLDYESLIPDSVTSQVYDRDVLAMVAATDSTYFQPGTAYSYSNSGYAILAMIIEKYSGETFPEFLRRNIFEPLGMNATVAFVDGINTVDNRAFGYVVEGDSVRFADQSRTSAVLGDGGVYSSVDDLYKWDQALYGNDLVSDSLMQQAYTPGLEDYGFGWRIEEVNGHVRHSHTGSTSGFRNVIQRFPDDKLTIIILTNRAGPDVAELANELAKLYF